MLARAHGTPIRIASKSVRCRALLERILARDERFRGLMTFTLAETLWLHGEGLRDLLLAYPTADRAALAQLARIEGDGRPTVMVDSVEQLDWIAAAAPDPAAPLRLCIEVDAGYRLPGGRVTIGPKRSPIRTPAQAAALAREIVRRPGFELAGLMAYEGHIAGVGDRPLGKPLLGPVLRRIQRASATELAERRAAVVEAVRAVAPIELVNGGGTGSLHTTAAEPAVTEVTAGSGFYAPTLFDRYSAFDQRPAAMFALPVVRRPRPDVVTLLGGGYIASGAPGRDRLPQPHLPEGLRLDPLEGAGEVQTPVSGPAAHDLHIGDNVYLRHAKAGELCEHFDRLHLIEGDEIVDELPTYRGEGRTFL
jgi:D-serine deaminase-like pyridoxal phosphate-dependent protein